MTAEQPSPRASDPADRHFQELLSRGDQEGAAAFLHDRFSVGLARSVAALAMGLGGGDEADAIANWTVCRAVLRGQTFDPGRGTLSRWLEAIARSRALSLLRQVREAGGVAEAPDRRPEVERVCMRHETLGRVLDRLPDLLRRILLIDLAYDGQATAAEVSRSLGIPVDGVYKQRCRARKIFRELWEAETGGPPDL